MTEKHEDEVHKLWSSFEAKMARFESDKKLALEWQKEELTMVVEQRLEQLTTEAEVREEEGKIELLRRQMQRTQGYRSAAATSSSPSCRASLRARSGPASPPSTSTRVPMPGPSRSSSQRL